MFPMHWHKYETIGVGGLEILCFPLLLFPLNYHIPNFNNLSVEQKLQTVMTKEYVQIFKVFMSNLPNEAEQTICLIMKS